MKKFFLNPNEMVASPRQGFYTSRLRCLLSKKFGFYIIGFDGVGSLAADIVSGYLT